MANFKLSQTGQEIQADLNKVENPDTTPALNSPNLITSGGVKTYVDNRFNGASKAVSFGNYSTMITALNALGADEYSVGQDIYIVTLNVPDLWVSSVESTSVIYTYVDDAAFISGLNTDGYVQVGYYRLSQLETKQVDLANYLTASQVKGLVADDFSTSSTYAVGDLVLYNDVLYRCTTAVSTAGDWTGSTNWVATDIDSELLDKANANNVITLDGTTNSYNTSKIINMNGYVFYIAGGNSSNSNAFQFLPSQQMFQMCLSYSSQYVRFTADGITNARNGTNNSLYYPVWKNNTGYILANTDFYPTFSSSATYNVGDIVYYRNGFFKCAIAITTPGNWDDAKWTSVTLGDELSNRAAPGIIPITTAPTADNTAGDLKFVVLSSEPATYYNGYYYIITGSNN